MSKLLQLEKEYNRALQDDKVARKVLSSIGTRLADTSFELAECLAGLKLHIYRGTILNRSANYKAGDWVVQSFSMYAFNPSKPTSLYAVRIHCSKWLKRGIAGQEKAVFYGGDFIVTDSDATKLRIQIKSQPGTKGGEANVTEEEGRKNAVC